MSLEWLLASLQAEGQLDSSGRFSLSLPRLLGFQLAEPLGYVRTVVSAAIAGGASWVEMACRAGHCHFRFDAQPLDPGQLRTLLGLGTPGAYPKELGFALVQALGTNPALVRICTSAAVLEVQAGQLVVDRHDSPGRCTSFEVVRRPTWRESLASYFKPSHELAILQESCRFSPVPVRANGQDLREPLVLGSCLALSRTADCPAVEAVAKMTRPMGDPPDGVQAVLAVGCRTSAHQPSLLLLRHGMSHYNPWPLSYPEGVRVIVSDPCLRVDLSRFELVRDQRLERLRAWLEDQLDMLVLELAQQSRDQTWIGPLLFGRLPQLWSIPPDPVCARLLELPLVRLADDRLVSLGHLREHAPPEGWLGYSLSAFRNSAWDYPVLLSQANSLAVQRALQVRFPVWIGLDHLASATSIARLPDADYLVRIPLLHCAGEVGLSPRPQETAPEESVPPGVRVSLPDPSFREGVEQTLPVLYSVLGREGLSAPAQDHLLSYIYWLAAGVVSHHGPRGPLRHLLRGDRPGPRALARAVHFARVEAPSVCLADLPSADRWVYRLHPGGPSGALQLTAFQWLCLERLLGFKRLRGHGITVYSGRLHTCCLRAYSFRLSRQDPIGTCDLLLAMLSQPDCAATRILLGLGVDPEKLRFLCQRAHHTEAEGYKPNRRTRQLERAFYQARSTARELGHPHAATGHLLLALLDSACPASESLLDLGAEPDIVAQRIREEPHQEAIEDLTGALASHDNPHDRAWLEELQGS